VDTSLTTQEESSGYHGGDEFQSENDAEPVHVLDDLFLQEAAANFKIAQVIVTVEAPRLLDESLVGSVRLSPLITWRVGMQVQSSISTRKKKGKGNLITSEDRIRASPRAVRHLWNCAQRKCAAVPVGAVGGSDQEVEREADQANERIAPKRFLQEREQKGGLRRIELLFWMKCGSLSVLRKFLIPRDSKLINALSNMRFTRE